MIVSLNLEFGSANVFLAKINFLDIFGYISFIQPTLRGAIEDLVKARWH